MRNVGTLTLALFALLMAAGFTFQAQAAPVVDQYTEQLPSPGGPVPVNPENTGKPGTQNSSGPDEGSGGSLVADGDNPVASDTNGNDASANKSEGEGQTAQIEGQGGSNDQDNSTGTVATSGGDDGGDGMGWIFPVALILVAAVIAGVAVSRRNRGNLAT